MFLFCHPFSVLCAMFYVLIAILRQKLQWKRHNSKPNSKTVQDSIYISLIYKLITNTITIATTPTQQISF